MKIQLAKSGISEVKLKRSPTVNRIQKVPADNLLAPAIRRKRPDSGNKENMADRANIVRPPPNPGQAAEQASLRVK